MAEMGCLPRRRGCSSGGNRKHGAALGTGKVWRKASVNGDGWAIDLAPVFQSGNC